MSYKKCVADRIGRAAVRGAVWTIGLGLCARAVGAVCTIVIVRFIAPEVMGEVLAAYIVTTLGHTVTRMGVDQYLIVKRGDDVAFHATFWMVVFGVLGLGMVMVIGEPVGHYLNAPRMGEYIPWCVIAVGIRRVVVIPECMLARDMRFGVVALAAALGELVYVAAALIMAGVFGMGAYAVVYGNIIQSVVLACMLCGAAGASEWLRPCRITWARTRDMMRYGVPLNFETALEVASQSADNLMFSYRFGAGPMGLYNIAYNLANIPASHIGDHISAVLIPSLARLPAGQRVDALIRSTGLLALVIFPMAVGLAVVAEPLIKVLLPVAWQGAAPFLGMLAVLSVFRPLSWAIGSYFKVVGRTDMMFCFAVVKVALLLGGMAVLPTPVWACASVGIGFGAHAIGMVGCVAWCEKVSPRRFVPGFVGPLMGCVVMAVVVLATDLGLSLAGVHGDWVRLLTGIGVGVLGYVPAAFVLAPGTTRELLRLLRGAYGRQPA